MVYIILIFLTKNSKKKWKATYSRAVETHGKIQKYIYLVCLINLYIILPFCFVFCVFVLYFVYLFLDNDNDNKKTQTAHAIICDFFCSYYCIIGYIYKSRLISFKCYSIGNIRLRWNLFSKHVHYINKSFFKRLLFVQIYILCLGWNNNIVYAIGAS